MGKVMGKIVEKRASRRLAHLGAAVVLSVGLGACATGKVDTGVFSRPAEDRGRIVVEAPAYEGVTPVRVRFRDRYEREEYALFRGDGGQAEIVFIETRPELTANVVLDFNKLIADTLKMWRFNRDLDLRLGDSVSVETDIVPLWVQPYRQRQTGRDCVGFYGNWDVEGRDPQLRPTKVLFGYHCAPAGTEMDAAAAATFVTSLQLRGISVPLRIESVYKPGEEPAPEPRERQTAHLVLAQDGGGGGIAGLPAFPLLAARVFTDSNGPPRDQ